MRNTYIIFSISALLMVFGLFMAPSKANAYGGYYYHYDIPSYSTDYPGYHGYRYSSYPMDNSYITPRVNNPYPYNYPRNNYNYNYNYNFYNAPVYETNDLVYPYSNYNMNYNNDYRNDNYRYENNESCYGYGC